MCNRRYSETHTTTVFYFNYSTQVNPKLRIHRFIRLQTTHGYTENIYNVCKLQTQMVHSKTTQANIETTNSKTTNGSQ